MRNKDDALPSTRTDNHGSSRDLHCESLFTYHLTSVERIKAVPRAASILAAKDDARCGTQGLDKCRAEEAEYRSWLSRRCGSGNGIRC